MAKPAGSRDYSVNSGGGSDGVDNQPLQLPTHSLQTFQLRIQNSTAFSNINRVYLVTPKVFRNALSNSFKHTV